MALALRATAATGDSFKRYAKSRVLELEKVLAEAAESGHGGVHKARRRLKALRSFFRMLRPAIGEEAFAEANAALRAAGHALAGARKAGAMLEAADKLAQSLGKDAACESARACCHPRGCRDGRRMRMRPKTRSPAGLNRRLIRFGSSGNRSMNGGCRSATRTST